MNGGETLVDTLNFHQDWICYALTQKGLLATSYMHKSEAQAIRSILHYSLPQPIKYSTEQDSDLSVWRNTLTRILSGKPMKLDEIPVDETDWSPFASKIYNYLRTNVPHGSVISYGALGRAAYRKNCARAVGQVMGSNQVAPVVPCHRVIASDGRLHGFSGFGGLKFKAGLLKLEGVMFEQSVDYTDNLRVRFGV